MWPHTRDKQSFQQLSSRKDTETDRRRESAGPSDAAGGSGSLGLVRDEVPGAGLEPARPTMGTADFKSAAYRQFRHPGDRER